MIKSVSIKLKPEEAADSDIITAYIQSLLGIAKNEITGFQIIKKSIDARSRQIWINLSLDAFINEPFHHRFFSGI
ncbi:MAG: hypothetical protein ACO29O_04530 [Chitinophagaceae bacterium]